MTMKYEDTKIKIHVKKHPNEVRYPGRACRDMMFAITDLCTKLSPEQMSQFGDGTLELDPEAALTDIQTMLPKDQIGVALQYDNAVIPTIMDVESIDHKNREILGKDVYSKEELSVSFAEASVSKALGFFEILYRDDKPYGQPEMQEVNVRIYHEEHEEKDPAEGETAPAASTPEAPATTVSEAQEPTKNDEPTDIL